MSTTAQTHGQLGRHSHLGPPWYSPRLRARPRSDPLGSYCHPSHFGRQAGTNPSGLAFTFPSTDLSGPDRLFRWGFAGLYVWLPQRQTRGLEFAAEQETGETPT